MIRIVLRSRIVRIPFSRFVAVNMASSSGDSVDDSNPSVDDSNPSVSPQAGGGKKAPQAGTGWMSSLRRFFSHPSEARDREYYEKLSLDSKRALYTCGSKYLTLDKIQTWEEFQERKPCPRFKQPSPFSVDPTLNKKVSLWKGDITRLEIDAIVNAANSSLLGGGGVDGAIHSAAGYSLRDECAMLGGCSTGDAKITSGHRLPAKYILHTVGPVDGSEHKLRSCYTRCLQLTLENKIQSVAFCCIATGVYGYPNKKAAEVALETTRKWLELNADKVERVIFCVFLNIDYKIYQELLHYYFPLEAPTDSGDHDGSENARASDGESHSSLEDTDGRSDNGGDGSVPRVPKLGRSATEPAHSTSMSKSSQPEGQTQQQPQVKEEQQITEQTSHVQEQEKAASDEVPPEQREEEQNRVVTEQMVVKQEQIQQVSQEQEEMVTDPPPVEKAMTPEHERGEKQVQQDTEQTGQQEENMEEEHTKKPRITTS